MKIEDFAYIVEIFQLNKKDVEDVEKVIKELLIMQIPYNF